MTPRTSLSGRVDALLAAMKAQGESYPPALHRQEVEIRPKRIFLQELLYGLGALEASEQSLLFSDKLLASRVLETVLGSRFKDFHPPAMGLKEFLEAEELVDRAGRIHAPRACIGAALRARFPMGFVAKPAFGWTSDRKSLHHNEEEFIAILSRGGGEFYSAEEFLIPFQPPKAGGLTSGERWMLMGRIEGTSFTSSDCTYGNANEYRIHTFHGKVVQGGTLTRWLTPSRPEKIERVNRFAQDFLDLLPKGAWMRQAWGLDVFFGTDGRLTLVEINTNRGERAGWSGYVRVPETLGAYTRHLEQHYCWRFRGVGGWMLRNDLSNLSSYLRHELRRHMKNAQNASAREATLDEMRAFAKRYFTPLHAKTSDPFFMGCEDFRSTNALMEGYACHLDNIREVGDPGWRGLLDWAQPLLSVV